MYQINWVQAGRS